MVVHWCGTGLSAIPGLKKLIIDGNNVIVWNRTVSKALLTVLFQTMTLLPSMISFFNPGIADNPVPHQWTTILYLRHF